jgi:hypothetical protein
MRLLPTLCAVVPFLSPSAFAEPGGPKELLNSAPSAPVGVVQVTGKVFFDLDENGVQDLPSEVGIAGFRVRALKDGVVLVTGETDSLGCYTLDVERKGKPKGYAVEILGPTGLAGRHGFIGEIPPVIGANWFLTNPPGIAGINIRGSEPGADFGVLSYGEIEGGALVPNLEIQGEDFWCDQDLKGLVLEILATCDPAWRLLLNDFCLQFSCLTNQHEAKKGILKFKKNADLSSALELLCRFFEKEDCGPTLLHVLSENVASVLLSSLCILNSSDNRIIMVRPNGVFVELTEQAAATRDLLCNDLALNPFQDPNFLAAVLDCINEWKDAVNGGVYGRSGEPLEPEYGEDV